MRVSAIQSYQSNPYFTADSRTKNKLKNAAGAAAIVLASAAPAMEADAQFYYIPPVLPPSAYYYNPNTRPVTTNIPNCFVVGDLRNYNPNKSMREVFDEIDSNGNKNGVITAKEVIRTERNNWNINHNYPYNSYQMQQTHTAFETISELYNDDDNSNPYTMTYEEYKAAMTDYMETKNINSFINLMKIYTVPYIYPPPPPHRYHPGPPPHRHHRH